eukprot:7250826-Pyramimonas_sp.AAC.1
MLVRKCAFGNAAHLACLKHVAVICCEMRGIEMLAYRTIELGRKSTRAWRERGDACVWPAWCLFDTELCIRPMRGQRTCVAW